MGRWFSGELVMPTSVGRSGMYLCSIPEHSARPRADKGWRGLSLHVGRAASAVDKIMMAECARRRWGRGDPMGSDGVTAQRAEVPPWPSQEGIGAIKKGLLEPFEYIIGPRSQSLSLIGQTEHTLVRTRVRH